MGRVRTNNTDLSLPKGVYAKPTINGHVFYTLIKGKYHGLGDDIDAIANRLDEARTGRRDLSEREALEFVIGSATWIAEIDSTMLITERRAKAKKIPFTIDRALVDHMLKEKDYRCTVTNYRFSHAREIGVRIRPYAPSIDRLNNRIGYEPGNIRIVCAFVNVALNQFGVDMLRQAFRDQNKGR